MSYFISYSRKDLRFAQKLVQALAIYNISTWFDKNDIPAGKRWDRVLETGLKNCQAVILILSPHSVKSENVLDEVGFALSQSKTLIPILIKETDIPFHLSRFQYLDFQGDFKGAFDKLMLSIESGSDQSLLSETKNNISDPNNIHVLFCPNCNHLLFNHAFKFIEKSCLECEWEQTEQLIESGQLARAVRSVGNKTIAYSTPAEGDKYIWFSVETEQKGQLLGLPHQENQAEVVIEIQHDLFASEPARFQNYIVITNHEKEFPEKNKSLLIFREETGSKAWSFDTQEKALSAPIVSNDHVFFRSQKTICAIDTNSRKLLWQRELETSLSAPAMVANENKLIVLGGYQAEGKIYVMSAKTGDILWQKEPVHSFDIPAVSNTELYLVDADKGEGFISALNLDTGNPSWNHPFQAPRNTRYGPFTAPPAVHENYLMIACGDMFNNGDGYALYALNVHTGEYIWRLQTQKHVRFKPVFSKPFFYIADNSGKISCHLISTGEEIWSYAMGKRPITQPVLAGGNLIVIDKAKNAYFVKADSPLPNQTTPVELLKQANLWSSAATSYMLQFSPDYQQAAKMLENAGMLEFAKKIKNIQ